MGVEEMTYPVKDLPLTNRVAVAEADIAYLNTSIMPIEAHTTSDTLTTAESGSVHTNLGASGTITLTLPASAAAGVWFTFAVQAPQHLRVDPGAATIRDTTGLMAGKYKWATAMGECLTLVADANGDWVTIARYGSWSREV